ncbi:helix-turn-helix domain-containing protein, partial [Staphylococcus haemolyticus]|uniref:helix-turn-helix domain-containing protein n=1 Tax=Staphylococcus haemolyticus TaxID=1283 RepID=UPI0029288D69
MYIVSSFSIFIQIKEVNTDELTFIESYYHQNLSVNEIAKRLKRSRQTIYKVLLQS